MSVTTPKQAPLCVEDQEIFVDALNPSETANSLSDCVTSHLQGGVAQLPMLDDKQSSELLSSLESTYMRNVDVFEMFIKRNVFSLQMFAPKRRQAILRAWQGNDDNDEAAVLETTKAKEDDSITTTTTYNSQFPASRNDIPSEQQIAELTSQLDSLRTRLAAVQQTKRNALHELQQLQAAEDLADVTSEKLIQATQPDDSSNAGLANVVSNTITKTQGLKDLQLQGQSLVQQMDDDKRGRVDDDNMDSVVINKKQKAKQQLSLTERFQQDKSTMETTTASLKTLHGQLVDSEQQRNKENAN